MHFLPTFSMGSVVFNQRFIEWSYEDTIDVLQGNFPHANILLVKPVYQLDGGYSIYSNFLSHHNTEGSLLLSKGGRQGAEDLTTRIQVCAGGVWAENEGQGCDSSICRVISSFSCRCRIVHVFVSHGGGRLGTCTSSLGGEQG